MRIIVVPLILVLFLSGCINASNPTQATPTRISLRATETPVPTLNGTPSPLPATLDLTDLTRVARATRMPLFEKYCSESFYRYFFNDLWGVCDTNNKTLIIFSVDGRLWQFSYVELGIALADEDSKFLPQIVYWTDDQRFVYVAPFPSGYDPSGRFYGRGIALLEVDLTNGQIQTILPNTNHFYSISFSPTGKYMAYAIFDSDKPLDLFVQDLQSGATKQKAQEAIYTQIGEFVWSNDELHLAYKLIIQEDACSRTFAIGLLNITEMTSKSIIDDTQVDTCQLLDTTYYINEVTDTSLTLEQHGDVWVYNNDTRQLLLMVTATPIP